MMSIALDRVGSVSGFSRAMAVFESPAERKLEEEDCRSLSGSSSSSSIGRNSDDDEENEFDRSGSDGGDCEEENEVQSCYKGSASALDMMNSLEEVLPIRRGISSFYNGKSKSFTSLADTVTTPSIRDIAKPENAYTRRRRNILAINHAWDKSRTKRSQSTLALAMAMSSSESLSSNSEDSNSNSTPSPRHLPPLYPQAKISSFGIISSSPPPRHGLSNWRSFSVADIQQCSKTTSMN